jgi:hypothetical protein
MKPKLHWSQIAMLCRCGVAFEFRYVKGIIKPPAIALIVGSATHVSIEKNLRNKMEKKVLLPDDEVRQFAADDVNRRWQEEGADLSSLDEDEVGMGEKAIRGEAVDMAVSLASLHGRELAPAIEPIHLERKWDVAIDGFPCDLQGTIDCQENGGLATGTRIRDVKTSKRSPPANKAEKDEQLTMYSLASHVLDKDSSAKELTMDFLVKTKTPKMVIQVTHRDHADYEPLLARIAVSAKAIESGIFLPCPPDSWCCDPRYCGFFTMCPFTRKKVSVSLTPSEFPL